MNTLCLDVGNSNLYGGVYKPDGAIELRFRKTSAAGSSADEYGLFLKSVLRENCIDPSSITCIGICSVVPDVVYSLKRACIKYFGLEPFLLKAGVKTGLNILYRAPQEVGANRIANAVAAARRYPDQNIIIVDCGTATTFDTITSERKYLGGAICPGLRIGMEALEKKTARLPAVEILRPSHTCGKTTVESIQSGLFFGHIGLIKEISSRIAAECFGTSPWILLGTGGFSTLFADSALFHAVEPDLVLEGLYYTMILNGEKT
jgi:type III pantothenate kinase